MTTVQKKASKWRDAHANLSRIMISSLMKKYDRNMKAVAAELGITTPALNWNIQKLGLLEQGAIDRYAISYELLGSKSPQTTNQTQAQTNKVA